MTHNSAGKLFKFSLVFIALIIISSFSAFADEYAESPLASALPHQENLHANRGHQVTVPAPTEAREEENNAVPISAPKISERESTEHNEGTIMNTGVPVVNHVRHIIKPVVPVKINQSPLTDSAPQIHKDAETEHVEQHETPGTNIADLPSGWALFSDSDSTK